MATLPKSDEALAKLGADVAREQRRRAIPVQIGELLREYVTLGGDVSELVLEPAPEPTPPAGVPDPTGGVINPDQEDDGAEPR